MNSIFASCVDQGSKSISPNSASIYGKYSQGVNQSSLRCLIWVDKYVFLFTFV